MWVGTALLIPCFLHMPTRVVTTGRTGRSCRWACATGLAEAADTHCGFGPQGSPEGWRTALWRGAGARSPSSADRMASSTNTSMPMDGAHYISSARKVAARAENEHSIVSMLT